MRLFTMRAVAAVLALSCLPGAASAQELRYSWLDMSYVNQDVDRSGTLPSPGIPDQIVEVNATDGRGVRFRGSLGSWKGFYITVDYASSDIDLAGSVNNPALPEPDVFEDEFDYTAIRGGLGFKYEILENTDIYAELTYDSLDFDFGSFAGENFDMDRQEVGATLGIRRLFGDHLTVQAYGRQTGVGDADLTTGEFDSDTLFGVGIAMEFVRGFSLVADTEIGEFTNISVGFRIDLDED